MKLRKIFYYMAVIFSLYSFVLSMEKADLSGEHPKILPEDLANLTDIDLEFKDSDVLEVLLGKIDESKQDPQNDFDGKFNVPEITDDANDDYPESNSKIDDLEDLKEDIKDILSKRDQEFGPRY